MRAAALVIPLSLALAGTAHAQAYQCRIPQTAPAIPHIEPDGPARIVPVTGYTLALSWSPEFCRRESRSIQCSGRNGRFGLVVHGLWPEGSRGSWPQWCRQREALPPHTAKEHLCMMPAPRLMAHEWAKHGSCMTSTPASYFNVTAILWRSLNLPDLDRLGKERRLDAGGIRAAFAGANPAIPRKAIGVFTGKGGWLKEIRLCYGRNFMPTPCHPRRAGAPDSAPVRIWRGL